MELFKSLFSSSGFMPQGFCYNWDPYVIWLNAASDTLIALAYFTIPITLVYFARRRRNLAFPWMFLCFAVFITACGITHVIEVWCIWRPLYWLAGIIKGVTAGVSTATAIALIRLGPQALTLPDSEALRGIGIKLDEARQTTRNANEELECSIAEHTASLAAAKAAMPAQIEEHKRVQAAMQEGEGRFRTMANSIPQLAWIAGADGSIFWYNQRWYEYTGTTPEQMERWGWESVQDPLALPTVLERWRDSIATTQPFDMELPLRGADGRFRLFLTRVVPLKDAQGQAFQWFGTNTDVSEHKADEAAMEQANEQLREQAAVLELAPVLVRDLESQIVQWNQGAEQLYGFSKKEALGRVSHELFNTQFPESRERVDEILRRTGRWEGQLVHRKRNGERLVVASQQIVYCDSTGRPARILEVNTDLTECKRVEEALQESRARFEGIINLAMDAIISIDEAQQVVLFNGAAERMFRCTASETLGQPLERFLPARLHSAHRAHVHAFAATGVTARAMGQPGSLTAVRADGQEFPIEASISQATVGKAKLFTVVLRDITERKAAEAAIQEANDQLREQAAALEQASVLVRDLDSRILLWTEGAERLYGFSKKEALGALAHQLFQTEFSESRAQIEEGLRSSGQWEGELVRRKRNGERIVVTSFWVLYRDLAGLPVRILETDVDISERKKAEQALHELNEQLERRVQERANDLAAKSREAELQTRASLEEKEVLLREIHHRIKNNLQVISSLLRLHSNYLRDPTDAEIFRDCQMRVQSMALVHDRLYRGGSLARINFGAHLAELATLIASGQRQGESNIVLSTDCEHVEVNLDAAVPLGLIATELISNAYKHAFRGRLDGRVTVSLKILPEQKVVLQVVDDGVGLPPELDLAIAKSLGIRLIRSLVRQLRGELIFRSQPLTTVEVVLNGDRLRS